MPRPSAAVAVALAGALALSLVWSSPARADNGPVLLSSSRTPAELDFNGGSVTITADATDDYGIFMAYAHVSNAADSQDVALSPSEVYADHTVYTGQAQLPPNPGPADLEWGVEIQLTDTNGAVATGTPGSVVVHGDPSTDLPPVVSGGAMSPTTLPSTGGQATVSATVTDDTGLDAVWAAVSGGDAGEQVVALARGSGDTWSGTVTLAPNGTHEAIGYQASVWARDLAGQEVEADGGETSVEDEPVFNEKPVVSQVVVSPTHLGRHGGRVVVTATVTDTENALQEVDALLGDGRVRAMEPIDGTHFRATWWLPANPSERAGTWTTSVRALDDAGQQDDLDGPDVTVAGTPARLVVTPGFAELGSVPAGGRTAVPVTVVNAGDASNLRGRVVVPDGPCRLRGSEGALRFLLIPRSSLSFTVVCRPTEPGSFRVVVPVTRRDGRQPALHLVVRGRGLRD